MATPSLVFGRKMRDSNPRYGKIRIPDFESGAFDHSANLPCSECKVTHYFSFFQKKFVFFSHYAYLCSRVKKPSFSMLTTTQAIVLHKTKYGDGRLLISMFTREYGMMSFAHNLSRSSRTNSSNLFQALTMVDIEFDLRPKAEVHHLRQVRLAQPMLSIPFHPQKLAMALFLADLMRFSLSHEQQNLELYDFLTSSIAWLDSQEEDPSYFHIIFSLHLLRFLGIAPPPVHSNFLSYDTMHNIRLSHEEQGEMLDAILDYYRYHLPSFPQLKSTAVLKEIL